MTFEEAKCCLVENKPIIDFKKYNEALGVAIVALAEIQEYRAIGTVEDIQLIFSLCKDLERIVKKYEKIGTIEEFKDLKEKNEPKKPQEISWGATKCPICGQEFGFNSHFNYCPKCGQKLDWSE